MTYKNMKEELYQKLSETIITVRTRDAIIVMGDINAKIGPNNEDLEHVKGIHGMNYREDFERNRNEEIGKRKCK